MRSIQEFKASTTSTWISTSTKKTYLRKVSELFADYVSAMFRVDRTKTESAKSFFFFNLIVNDPKMLYLHEIILVALLA